MAEELGDIRFHPTVSRFYDVFQIYFERYQAPEHRRYLADDLEGRVLELGFGTGVMLPYYDEADHDPKIHAVEPDPGMREQASEKASSSDVEVDQTAAVAENLPYKSNCFDHVVECGLLCSAPEPDSVFTEVSRVLRPDGEFRFLDHVRSPGWIGVSQDKLTPIWKRIGGNCHLDREIAPMLQRHPDIEVTEIDHLSIGHWPIREFVRGKAQPR